MPLTPQQRLEVERVFTQVAKNAFQRLGNLTLAAQPLNPFVAALVARTPVSLAEFIVGQRVERGLVTSLGMQLQRIAAAVGTAMRATGVSGADLEGSDTGLQRRFLMQVKSGPDTINLDISRQIRANLNSAEARIRSGGLPQDWVVVKMLGMCYGRPEHRSNWVQGLGAEGFDADRIGRGFWEFITGDPGAYVEVFDIAREVAGTYQNGSGKTLAQAIQDAVVGLAREIDVRYGDGSGGIDWRKLLDDNM